MLKEQQYAIWLLDHGRVVGTPCEKPDPGNSAPTYSSFYQAPDPLVEFTFIECEGRCERRAVSVIVEKAGTWFRVPLPNYDFVPRLLETVDTLRKRRLTIKVAGLTYKPKWNWSVQYRKHVASQWAALRNKSHPDYAPDWWLWDRTPRGSGRLDMEERGIKLPQGKNG